MWASTFSYSSLRSTEEDQQLLITKLGNRSNPYSLRFVPTEKTMKNPSRLQEARNFRQSHLSLIHRLGIIGLCLSSKMEWSGLKITRFSATWIPVYNAFYQLKNFATTLLCNDILMSLRMVLRTAETTSISAIRSTSFITLFIRNLLETSDGWLKPRLRTYSVAVLTPSNSTTRMNSWFTCLSSFKTSKLCRKEQSLTDPITKNQSLLSVASTKHVIQQLSTEFSLALCRLL